MMSSFAGGTTRAGYSASANANFVVRDIATSSTGGQDGGPIESEAAVELYAPFAFGSSQLDGGEKYGICDRCLTMFLNCTGASGSTCTGGSFLAQTGTFNVISAPLTDAGTVNVSVSNIKLLEWDFTNDVPLAGGRCVQLAQENFSASY